MDNSLSHFQCPVIIYPKTNSLPIRHLGNIWVKFENQNGTFYIQDNEYANVGWKRAAILLSM